MTVTPKLPSVQTPPVGEPKRWRPGPFEGLPGDLDRAQLDTALRAIFDHSYGLEQSSVQAVVAGTRMASGALIIPTGGVLKAVATGLSTVSNVVGSVDTGKTPNGFTWSVTPSATVPGAFDVYVFQPTSASVTTPIAATVPVTFRWHAWGT